MPHINLGNDLPGMRGLMAFSPATAEPMNLLAEILLRSNDGLTPTERELIGTHVSYLNDCFFCQHAHAAIACHYLNSDKELVDDVRENPAAANISNKLKALLNIAALVQNGGKYVTPEAVAKAKQEGATDKDIHDTVLIAAMFCMANRYVDGLGAITPTDLSTYPPRAKQVAENGYGNHIFSAKQPTAQ